LRRRLGSATRIKETHELRHQGLSPAGPQYPQAQRRLAEGLDRHPCACLREALPALAGPRLQSADSTLADLKALHVTLGIDRVVFTQPSIYGIDNAAILDGMAALNAKTPNRARAVVAIGWTRPTTTSRRSTLRACAACGSTPTTRAACRSR